MTNETQTDRLAEVLDIIREALMSGDYPVSDFEREFASKIMATTQSLSTDLANAEARVKELYDALAPFRAFEDSRAPDNLPITSGSSMAKRQLTMGDVRRLVAVLNPGREIA